MALTQDVQVCVVSRNNAFLYLTSGELDQLHNQTQVLYIACQKDQRWVCPRVKHLRIRLITPDESVSLSLLFSL